MNQYGVYGKFRSLQNAAWRCLADCNINTIPVKATAIARRYGGYGSTKQRIEYAVHFRKWMLYSHE